MASSSSSRKRGSVTPATATASASASSSIRRQEMMEMPSLSSPVAAASTSLSQLTSFLASPSLTEHGVGSATTTASSSRRNSTLMGNGKQYNKTVEYILQDSERDRMRQRALEEANAVMSAQEYIGGPQEQPQSQSQTQQQDQQQQQQQHSSQTNGQGRLRSLSSSTATSYLDNFNLLGVVTTPRTLDGSAYGSSHHGTKSVTNANMNTNGHGINTPERRNSTGMNAMNGGGGGGSGPSSNYQNNNSGMNANANTSANQNGAGGSGALGVGVGMGDLSSMLDFSHVSESLTKEIQSLNTTIYSYSQNYLGHLDGFGMIPGGGGAYGYGGSKTSSLDFETELSMVGFGSGTGSSYGYAYGGGGEDIPSSQRPMEELPDQLVHLDLTTVEAYLRKCGRLAQKLKDRNDTEEKNKKMEEGQDVATGEGEGASAGGVEEDQKVRASDSGNDDADNNEKEVHDPLSEVPEIFFSQYFDLTNPKIFESLLVLKDDDDDDGTTAEDRNGVTADTSSNSMAPAIRIQKPEKFTQHLDNIELALLNQVRSKSDSFFRETNRFSYLKSLVADSVEEVTNLRSELDQIRDRSVNDAEMIPVMDRRRNDIRDLVEVLDEIGDVLEVKSSVAGLIAAGDYLGAVDAIHMARRLLNGEETAGQESRHVLKKLTALNKVNDQLAQYENLVVMDLSKDLVESFLSWNSSASSINSGISISTSLKSDERQNVKQTILAMKKCKRLSTVADIYREKLCDTIRVTIRTTVNECAADAAKDASLLPSASATIVSIPYKDSGSGGASSSKASIIEGVTSMSFAQFMECLDMIYEHVLSYLKSAAGVNKFCLEEGISFKDEDLTSDGTVEDRIDATVPTSSNSPSALFAGADLSHRSISEILQLRKEAHSLISFEEMRRLWDSCLAFTLQIDKISGQKNYILRNTLLAQARAFVERKHESNMSSLAAALDSERWTQCDVSNERQNTLDRLCSGRAVISSTRDNNMLAPEEEQNASSPFASVEGKQYRVVWSCLLLIEMIMGNVACAAHFQNLATNVVGKVSELLRLFNLRATQLVLGAGAIHSSARLKSINAKHLALVTQCVGVVKSILPHIRAALMAQLPSKHHLLLTDLDKIKKEYAEHHDKVLSKFVSIIGGIVEHSLISRISSTDFEKRSKLNNENGTIECCPFLDGVITNTRKMHQVLISLLPNEDLMDVFSRIFAHLDTKIPKILLAADSDEKIPFSFPQSMNGKRRIILEVEAMADTLNNLPDVRPWDFGAMKFLSRRLEVKLEDKKEDENRKEMKPDSNEKTIDKDPKEVETDDNKENNDGAKAPVENQEEIKVLVDEKGNDSEVAIAEGAKEVGRDNNGNDASRGPDDSAKEKIANGEVENDASTDPDQKHPIITNITSEGDQEQEINADTNGQSNMVAGEEEGRAAESNQSET